MENFEKGLELIPLEECSKGEHWLAKHGRLTAVVIALTVNAIFDCGIHEIENGGVKAALSYIEAPAVQPAIYYPSDTVLLLPL